MRRLLPASLVTLVAVAIGSRVFTDLQTEGLPGDIVASVLQVANWRFLFDDQSYADLFATPSPVLHFWSLAIEEQFYWLFPLLTAVVFAVGRGSVKIYAAVVAAPAGRVRRDRRRCWATARAPPSTTPPTPAWARSSSGRCWRWPCRSA